VVGDLQFPHAVGDDSGGPAEDHSWLPFALLIASIAAFFGLEAYSFFQRYSLPLRCEAGLYLCLVLLATLAAIPAVPVSRKLVARVLSRRRWPLLLFGVWLLPYLVYGVACGDFRWPALLRLLALSVPPLVLYRAAPVRNLALLSWQDVIAWSWLMLAVVLRQLTGIWNVPVNLDFMSRLFVIAVASWCWVFIRPVTNLGYSFSVSWRTLRAAAVNFGGFALCAIPAAYALRFAGWSPHWRGLPAFTTSFVEIFVFIAWLEELFFRGVLQTLLSNSLHSPVRGQSAASLAFGLSHILLAPAPNWRYVALASVAGWFYGSAFRQAGNLVGSSLTHALVDAVWRTWFGRS
jgi:membrane protease YdiL (CAAX protease family)